MRLILILIIFTLNIFSQYFEAVDFSFNQSGQGIRAQTLGGSFTGIANDHASVFWNPSGLSRVKKITFESSFYTDINTIATSYAGENSNSEKIKSGLSSISLIYPYPVYRGSLVFALSYQKVKVFNSTTQFAAFDTSHNFKPVEYQYQGGVSIVPFFMKNVFRNELINEKGSIDHFSLAMGMDLLPDLAVGTSLVYIRGYYQYNNYFKQNDVQNNYSAANIGQDVDLFSGRQSLDFKMNGLEAKFGITWFPIKNMSLGARIDIPIMYHVNEEFLESNSIYFDDPQNNLPIIDNLLYDGKENYFFKYPLYYSLGFGYRYSRTLFSGQIDYRDWSGLKIEREDGYPISNKPALSAEYHYRIGVEHLFRTIGLSLRSGFHVTNEPFKNLQSRKQISELSGGIGYLISGSFAINIGAKFSIYKINSPGDDIMPQKGIKEQKSTVLLVGLIHRL